MKIDVPSSVIGGVESQLDVLKREISRVEFFEPAPGMVFLYEGTQPPAGYIEDTNLTSPHEDYIYVRKS
jgi:hypothetical protein